MIKKRNNSYGLNTNVYISMPASANAFPNITNHIYIRDVKKGDSENNKPQILNFQTSGVTENNILPRDVNIEKENEDEHITTILVKEPQKIYARETIITTEVNNQNEINVKPLTAEQMILDTYPKILVDKNKA